MFFVVCASVCRSLRATARLACSVVVVMLFSPLKDFPQNFEILGPIFCRSSSSKITTRQQVSSSSFFFLSSYLVT